MNILAGKVRFIESSKHGFMDVFVLRCPLSVDVVTLCVYYDTIKRFKAVFTELCSISFTKCVVYIHDNGTRIIDINGVRITVDDRDFVVSIRRIK